MTECRHGMETDWCGECAPRSIEPVRSIRDRGTVFTAMYDGTCYSCSSTIYTGEEMMARDGEYLCQDCMPDAPDPDDPFG